MSADETVFNGRSRSEWLRDRTSGDGETRWEAIDAIRHLCEPAESVPLFIDTLLNDRYWRARALAAHALYDLAVDPFEDESLLLSAAPALRQSLNDSSPDVRSELAALIQAVARLDE